MISDEDARSDALYKLNVDELIKKKGTENGLEINRELHAVVELDRVSGGTS